MTLQYTRLGQHTSTGEVTRRIGNVLIPKTKHKVIKVMNMNMNESIMQELEE